MNLAGGNLTLEAWIKPPNMNQYAPILAKRQASGNYQQYQIGIGSVNRGGSAVSGKSIFAFFTTAVAWLMLSHSTQRTTL